MTPLPEIESAGVNIVSDTTVNWTADNAIEFDVSSLRSSQWTFDTEYRIPAEHVGVSFRVAFDYEGYLLVFLDGQKIASIARSQRSNSKTSDWEDMLQLAGSRTVNSIDDLDPGAHTLRVETSDNDPSLPPGSSLGPVGSVYLDVPIVYDEREWDQSNFSNTVNSNGRLDGPPGVYSEQALDFQIQPLQRATGATLNATVSDTTNEQAIAVGPDVSNLQVNSNSTNIDRDFASSTRDFVARVVVGGADGTTASGPNDGVETFYTNYRTVPQSLDELIVAYDALGSPSIGESIDNSIEEILTAKSDRANTVWELQYDESIGEPRVVVTQVGQREGSADPDLADFRVEKDVSRELSGATVYGRSQSVEGEQFTGSTSGTSLSNERIDPDSERVFDGSGTEFVSVEDASGSTTGDYEIDYQDGFLSITSGGSMTAGQSYFIDYGYTPSGTVNRNVGFSNHRVETLNAIRSDSSARGAASFIVDQLDEPQFSAEITIPQREAGFDLVDTIAPDQLPAPPNGRYEIQSIDETNEQLTLTLGARRSAGDVIREIERTLAQTARET
jgi:hypothetical protein